MLAPTNFQVAWVPSHLDDESAEPIKQLDKKFPDCKITSQRELVEKCVQVGITTREHIRGNSNTDECVKAGANQHSLRTYDVLIAQDHAYLTAAVQTLLVVSWDSWITFMGTQAHDNEAAASIDQIAELGDPAADVIKDMEAAFLDAHEMLLPQSYVDDPDDPWKTLLSMPTISTVPSLFDEKPAEPPMPSIPQPAPTPTSPTSRVTVTQAPPPNPRPRGLPASLPACPPQLLTLHLPTIRSLHPLPLSSVMPTPNGPSYIGPPTTAAPTLFVSIIAALPSRTPPSPSVIELSAICWWIGQQRFTPLYKHRPPEHRAEHYQMSYQELAISLELHTRVGYGGQKADLADKARILRESLWMLARNQNMLLDGIPTNYAICLEPCNSVFVRELTGLWLPAAGRRIVHNDPADEASLQQLRPEFLSSG